MSRGMATPSVCCAAVAILNLLDLRGVARDQLAAKLPRPEIAGDQPRQTVRDIIGRVRAEGDDALLALTRQFDGVDRPLLISEAEIDAAMEAVDGKLIAAFQSAISRIEIFHEAQRRAPEHIETPELSIRAYQRPVQRAGLYVPGGRAEYPSTVLMTAVPARVAGVSEIVLCVPPNTELGTVGPSVLVAARLAGVKQIFAVGGAQAIAAMAYGTATIPAVDVIAGPGNVFVAIAKQEVAADVGVAAAFAGPSEVVVVADHTAPPELAAVDVLVQAEHGPDGLAWLITWDQQTAEAVTSAAEALIADSPRREAIESTLATSGYIALVDGPEAAIAVSDAIAPEHLQLMCAGAEDLAGSVENAGAIFCGPWSPASMGDYIAGPSHVLPTNGSARFSSALTVADFVKDHHVVTVTPAGIRELGDAVVTMADCEGLSTHAESIRLRQNLLAETGELPL